MESLVYIPTFYRFQDDFIKHLGLVWFQEILVEVDHMNRLDRFADVRKNGCFTPLELIIVVLIQIS